MAKGRPIFIKRVPWHEQYASEDILTPEVVDGFQRASVELAAKRKCCKQGCSRCMRKPT